MTYEEAVKELWAWQYSNTSCFHNMFFSLIQKADWHNRERLAQAFPMEVKVYTEWCDAPTHTAFFEINGFKV